MRSSWPAASPVAPAGPLAGDVPDLGLHLVSALVQWAAMTVERDGPLVRYRSRRRWPGPVPAASSVTVEVGEAIPPGELTQFDHHLTARWQLYTRIGAWRPLGRPGR